MNVSLPRFRPVREMAMRRLNGSAGADEKDWVAAEEPLEIHVEGQSIAIVMRTPGEDHELAAGFLVTEGLLHGAGDLAGIAHPPHCLVSGLTASAGLPRAVQLPILELGPPRQCDPANLPGRTLARNRPPADQSLPRLKMISVRSSDCARGASRPRFCSG